MTRQFPRWLWPLTLLAVTGCGDNIEAVFRDHYNVQHEIIDNMVNVVDDASAKKFNENYTNRFKKKEEVIKERKEKITNNQYSEKDKKILDKLIEDLQGNLFKTQVDTLDSRFRVLQNWHRRVMVKLTEDRAAEDMRSKADTFTVKSTDVCPNLMELAMPAEIAQSSAGGSGAGTMLGAPGGGVMPAPGGGAAMPGGAQGGPAMPAGAAGAGGAEKKKVAAAPVDPLANARLTFVITCVRAGNGWQEPQRAWFSGSKKVDKLEVNGVNLVPLTSTQ